MKYVVLAITLLFTVPAHSQVSIGVSPVSMPAWGKAEGVHMAEISYSGLGFHYFIQSEKVNVADVPLKPRLKNRYYHNPAISFRYPVLKFFRVGAIAFTKQFPEANASRLNLWLDAGVDIGRLRLSYVHISNVFLAPINTGYDAISVALRLW